MYKSLAAGSVLAFVVLSFDAAAARDVQSGSAPQNVRPAAPVLSLDVRPKALDFHWTRSRGAQYYKLLRNKDGRSGYTPIALTVSRRQARIFLAAHLHQWQDATYLLLACNRSGCTNSNVIGAQGREHEGIDLVFAPANHLAMSADGRTLVAAHMDHSDEFISSGVVFIYRRLRHEWHLQQTLFPPQPLEQSSFGRSVALSADGKTLAIGASTEVVGEPWERAGSVFVYKRQRSGWVQHVKLVAPQAQTDDHAFGTILGINARGDLLAVGSRYDSHPVAGAGVGSVSLYRLRDDAWQRIAHLTPPQPELHDAFGAALALSGNGRRLVVQAEEENEMNCDIEEGCRGRLNSLHTYTFDGSSWHHEGAMESIRGGAGFGAGLDLDWRGTTLAVGARGYQPASERGAILLYSRNEGTWSAPEIIEPSLTNREAFGESFALSSSGKVLATIAAEHGVYPKVFLVSFTRNRTGWSQRSILDSPSPDTFVDGFGRSMAISFTGGTLAVGGARYYPDPNDLNVWRDVVYVY